MQPLDTDHVQKFLQSLNFEVKYQQETKQLYIILKIEGADFPLFVRVYDEGDLLQLIAFIPCNIKPGTQGDVARLLHQLNKEIDTPGFGMDETSNVIFYRLMLPGMNKQFDEKLLQLYMTALPVIIKSFTPVIVTAAGGHATYDQIIQKMGDLEKNKKR